MRASKGSGGWNDKSYRGSSGSMRILRAFAVLAFSTLSGIMYIHGKAGVRLDKDAGATASMDWLMQDGTVNILGETADRMMANVDKAEEAEEVKDDGEAALSTIGVMCGRLYRDRCSQCAISERYKYLCKDDCRWHGGKCVPVTLKMLREEHLLLKERLNELENEIEAETIAVTEESVSEIHRTLTLIVDSLKGDERSHGRLWFAAGGTLLGALRCRPPGMLRWEDGIELGVRADDLEEVHEQLRENPHLKWERHSDIFAYSYGLARAGTDSWYPVDVIGFGRVNSHWHTMKSDGRSGYENEESDFMKDEEIQDIFRCQFWDLTLNCPIGGTTALERRFGANVFSEAAARKMDGLVAIELGDKNLNQHGGYFPAMTRELMAKLRFEGSE